MTGGIDREEKRRKGHASSTKTIDFKWRLGDKTVFASHKYPKESGGAQENQYQDLRAFVAEANHSLQPSQLFIAIADGEHYQRRDSEAQTSRLERLKQEANNSKGVYACSIDELPALLARLKG